MGGTNSNNNIPRLNRPELGGAGQIPLARSMTTKRKNTVTLKM